MLSRSSPAAERSGGDGAWATTAPPRATAPTSGHARLHRPLDGIFRHIRRPRAHQGRGEAHIPARVRPALCRAMTRCGRRIQAGCARHDRKSQHPRFTADMISLEILANSFARFCAEVLRQTRRRTDSTRTHAPPPAAQAHKILRLLDMLDVGPLAVARVPPRACQAQRSPSPTPSLQQSPPRNGGQHLREGRENRRCEPESRPTTARVLGAWLPVFWRLAIAVVAAVGQSACTQLTQWAWQLLWSCGSTEVRRQRLQAGT